MGSTAHTTDSDGNPNVFNVKRNDDGDRWLNGDYANADNKWNLDARIVFRLRNSIHFSFATVAGEFCFKICPYHPPNILPIMAIFSDKAMYLLVSISFISHAIWRKILIVSTLMTALCRGNIFWFFGEKLATDTASILSMNNISIFAPMEYFDVFGNFANCSCHRIYTSFSRTRSGKIRWGGITFLVMSGRFKHAYNDIISVENVLGAWKEFLSGKRSREDVRIFESTLMDNIFLLHYSLANRTYRHGAYHSFNITDPKPRNIHKASVKDRLLHHAIHRILYPSFDRTFIFDSYSCRDGKGIHKALNRFKSFFFEASKNNTRTVWVLKCDIRKFFASIYHKILMSILAERIHDQDILFLLDKIISSFQGAQGKGVPLGNLTSQLFANIYMNEFDHFMKRHMCAKYYIRYADDFVILSDDREYLEGLIPRMSAFLGIRLGLDLHPNKMFIKSFASGVDFLGWVHFPDHRVLRTVTKRRMFKNLRGNSSKERLSSYRGLMSHGNTHILQAQVENLSKN